MPSSLVVDVAVVLATVGICACVVPLWHARALKRKARRIYERLMGE